MGTVTAVSPGRSDPHEEPLPAREGGPNASDLLTFPLSALVHPPPNCRPRRKCPFLPHQGHQPTAQCLGLWPTPAQGVLLGLFLHRHPRPDPGSPLHTRKAAHRPAPSHLLIENDPLLVSQGSRICPQNTPLWLKDHFNRLICKKPQAQKKR